MGAKVIHFEGIDGSGKTTAYTYFIEQLREKGFKVLDTREVGNPHIPICVALRKLVLDPSSKLDGRSMEFIFAAMGVENTRLYESVKDEYDFIVSDRGWFSHLAYTDHNVSEEFTKNLYLDLLIKHVRLPDLVIFLAISPEVALARRNARNGFVDAIEAKGPEFQKKVYESFRKYLETSSVLNIDLDANQALEEVRSDIRELVETIAESRK